MKWTAQQDNALVSVRRWMDGGGKDVFRLFGYAGTGKTTLAKHFAEGIGGDVIYCAFTGKAAYVLQQKGCDGATTIHSLIYKPTEKDKTRMMELKKELEDWESHLKDTGSTEEQIDRHPEVRRVREELEVEKAKHRRPSWAKNEDSPVKNAKMVIVDECSMVDQQLGEDLMSFEVPVLVLGDPAQLPPVRGTGYFTNHRPNVLLTDVQRQAKDNPIIRMATDVREGRALRKGQYGDSKVVDWNQVDKDDVLAADQVLVGTNRRRHAMNDRIRSLLGREQALPVRGDKVVCLRNNHDLGLLNGSLWYVEDAVQIEANAVDLTLRSDDDKQTTVCSSHTQYFLGEEPPFWDIKEHECFDYGNALTGHKAQGSQWAKTYVFDESRVFRQDARAWLYTTLTRASESVAVAME